MFEFNSIDTKGYNGRINSDAIRLFIISLIASVLGMMLSGWMAAITLFALLFAVQFFKVDARNRYYITHLKIDTYIVTIVYTDRAQEKNITGAISDFTFKKRYSFSKSKVPSLVVTYKRETIITQYETGEWNEALFNKIVSA